MSLKLYFSPGACSFVPHCMLQRTGAEYEPIMVKLHKGEQHEADYQAINPRGQVPVLVDAGVGTASDAAVGMELGCDGILMNTAIAEAKDPVRMARAMKLAVEAGREAYLAGRMGTRKYADPSSPLAGLI